MITTTATAAAAAADTASSASYNENTCTLRGENVICLCFLPLPVGVFLHSIPFCRDRHLSVICVEHLSFPSSDDTLVQPRIYVSSRQNILFSTLGFHRNEYSEFAMNFTGVIHASVCSACKSYQPIRVLMKFIQNKCTRFYLLYRLM